MWPWSKIRELETRVERQRKELDLARLDNSLLTQKLNKVTDRDTRGRFKK